MMSSYNVNKESENVSFTISYSKGLRERASSLEVSIAAFMSTPVCAREGGRG